ncbi:unnamed protein product [Thlaspi arvense]|uniref:PIG-P domain-containing protein n=1 Tax=Thlaspi arvense TaxID=13288 RepID=A0AAU9RVK2_THLAR|nr:unnamed protein product [Thlaspi arvense]
MEEEAHLVNDPRNILSFSKRKNQESRFQDSDSSKSSPFKVHGPKPSEVYGFVGSISTVVATVMFLIWAYVPDKFLESIGISYYPSKYWAMAMPTYSIVTLLLALAFYIGLNFMSTSNSTSLNTLFDDYSREAEDSVSEMKKEEDRQIESISDIGITRINDLCSVLVNVCDL